jgi:hypothetical protein
VLAEQLALLGLHELEDEPLCYDAGHGLPGVDPGEEENHFPGAVGLALTESSSTELPMRVVQSYLR